MLCFEKGKIKYVYEPSGQADTMNVSTTLLKALVKRTGK